MKIGLICPEMSGHLNPMTTLGRELQKRGHDVSLIASADAERKAIGSGLNFLKVGLESRPLGSTANHLERLGELSGQEALAWTIYVLGLYNETILKDAPAVIKDAGIEALILDQVYPSGASVAHLLGLPFVTVCNALPLNPDPSVPPVVAPLFYDPSPEGRARNIQTYAAIDQMRAPIVTMINGYRTRWNLPVTDEFSDRSSKLAQIVQLPEAFDLPHEELPDSFHYTGPFHDAESGDTKEFPFDRLNGKPLIYASMGTLQNRLGHVFRTIAAACQDLDAQLVLSLGSRDQEIPTDFPGDPIVVSYAPQLELIKRATVVITHAGLNTALESLAQGVPMVAIPITNDQPGVAARIVYHGVGEAVTLANLTEETLREAVQKVLAVDSYRIKAEALQQEFGKVDGVRRGADIVEEAFRTRVAVLR